MAPTSGAERSMSSRSKEPSGTGNRRDTGRFRWAHRNRRDQGLVGPQPEQVLAGRLDTGEAWAVNGMPGRAARAIGDQEPRNRQPDSYSVSQVSGRLCRQRGRQEPERRKVQVDH
jgi:hypothetical protein